jgi:signal transduction histidine kinase
MEESADQRLARRAAELYEQQYGELLKSVSRVFAWLMAGQWIFGVLIALLYSPYGWSGKVRTIGVHVPTAIVLGGILSSLPLFLTLTRPTMTATRYVVACAQMLWSALLIHLTGGRIETHFHVFGSLAFLAFYRDWRILVPATIVVASDHLFRGLFWPESVYGITNPEWWRFLEHAFWVVFEDIVLVAWCLLSVREMRHLARQRAEGEVLSAREAEKSTALDRALHELTSQESIMRREKLAAVGQLAASVGHELRNPLGAVRNASTYVAKRIATTPVGQDAKVTQFLALIDRELVNCTRIISDLLDFARDRPPSPQPCPLRPLVDEAIGLIPNTSVAFHNEVPDTLPVPRLDKDQFRQVLINLMQNAAEAVPNHRSGDVRVRAAGGDGTPLRIEIEDNGSGVTEEVVRQMFEPLFTTKTKGTGLGLAIVAGIVKAHGGTIRVESKIDHGTTVAIEIPRRAAEAA